MEAEKTLCIPYGERGDLEFHVPAENLLAVVEPPDVPPVDDVRGEVRRALAEPIGTERLRDLVRKIPADGDGPRRFLIIADDITRLTPTRDIIPEVLDEMNAGGVRDDEVTLLIALGTHRLMTDDEIVEKYGQEVVDRIAVVNHDYRDVDGLVDLGRTKNGTPIIINRRVQEADFAIGVGSVYPHHIPGFAGGSKIVQPGVSGEATTGATHLLGTKARPCYLGCVDNPVRQEMDAVARKAGVHTILNTVQNAGGEPVAAFYGDLQAAFRAAVEKTEETLSAPVPQRADIVIAGSYPADLEFWQAHKTLYPAEIAAKEGGTLIIVTPCSEGVAVRHPEMVDYTGWPPERIYKAAAEGQIPDTPAAALALAWAHVRQGRQVSIVSCGLSDEEAQQLGFVPFEGVDEALQDAFERHGPDAKVTVVPRAPETLPVLVDDDKSMSS